ncbi:MAG: N-(5'-phosphoribosyl)anthranilate isomerase [Candidatus Altiarchaeales archaeon]|nr:MAG: N-(5'-phosphoribosyl)anthranilate isomerase [Candidatus Altiarchaeales archaeon]RLI94256.1 MAG: N-(5'-phosphoribosyl)anthranilate isomerase [Candidatus Altiarchaeales archaeon]HDO82103.1 phosphoribosylanthranilate isomerase [Candidatus Altiarchaeales archaeon]HEX54752.1 phosphoribosylanthranilate isomerase [Candidatus Altiarchaeales archaeon]
MTKVKICGITNREDASMAVKYGADALGFIAIDESPRFLKISEIAKICQEIPVFVSRVLVLKSEDLNLVKYASRIGIQYLQLYQDIEIEFLRRIKEDTNLGIIKHIPVDENAIENARRYEEVADAILLDTKTPNSLGGTGKTHDWDISRDVVKNVEKPVILAGGLNPENVREAIKKVKPYAVDVSSGVESKPGKKDKKKVEEFIRNAKNETAK